MKHAQLLERHKLHIGLAALLVALALLGTAFRANAGSQGQAPFPAVIPLPDGFQPEGIATGRGTEFFVGSIPTGAIYQGDLRTGEGSLLVEPQSGRAAIGLHLDQRTNYLFVSGGPTGKAYVYDADSGALLAEYTLTTSTDTFINDVIVTKRAAYFTDSRQPVIYRVPLGPGGKLLDQAQAEAIPLSGDYLHESGFNANGITATPDGEWLIIVQSNLGRLYRVDPDTGQAEQIDLGGVSLTNGDGILLDDETLYVVQNRLNQIAVVELAPDYLSGEVVRYITDPNFRVPTTIAEFGDALYAVNARFGTPPTPETEYEVVRVAK